MTQDALWVAVDDNDPDTYFVAFEGTCNQARGSECRGSAHGHVRLCTDEGLTARIPFPCASQEGLQKLLEHERKRDRVSDEEIARIMSLREVRALPSQLTDDEKAVLENGRRLERATHYAYGSHF